FLCDAIERGWADANALEKNGDLKSLHGDERFAPAFKASTACREEQFVLWAGSKVKRDVPAGLLVVLQGLGCGPRAEVPYWKPSAEKLGMVIVAPRAPTEMNAMFYGWQRRDGKDKDSSSPNYFDIEAAQQRVDEAIREAQQKHQIDPKRIVVSGFSQGGGVA